MNKIRAYKLQDAGADTVEANEQLGFGADVRDYSLLGPMVEHLRIRAVRLMTNNPLKRRGLSDHGIHVEDRIQHLAGLGQHNIRYLETKAERMGHLLPMQGA